MSDDVSGREWPRLFTIADANALLPVLIPRLERLRSDKERLDAERHALDQLAPAMRANGHGAKAVRHERNIADLMTRLSLGVREITEMGIEVKDLNQGLIDFPAWRDGRIVFLCWRLGEPSLAFWHDVDAGFAGREPIDPNEF